MERPSTLIAQNSQGEAVLLTTAGDPRDAVNSLLKKVCSGHAAGSVQKIIQFHAGQKHEREDFLTEFQARHADSIRLSEKLTQAQKNFAIHPTDYNAQIVAQCMAAYQADFRQKHRKN